MTIFRRIPYSSNTKISTLTVDDTNEYLWVGFTQDLDGNCIIKKTSAHSPDQVFFNLEKEVDSLVEATIVGNFIYYAYEDSSLLGEKISLSNPLTTATEISKPGGVTEDPIDITNDGTFIYFLLPGNTSGNNTQILKYSTTPSLSETIDLTDSSSTITNAISFTYDSDSGEFWIITDQDPTEKIRVYQESGGIWIWEVK